MNQHVRELPQPRKRSDPATPEIAWERFVAVAKELPPLFKRHWEEASAFQQDFDLDPNWQALYDLDLTGRLAVLTVRSNGTLVGYAFLVLGASLNYASKRFAQLERIWLEPAYREGWRGYKMVKEVVAKAKEIGVDNLSSGHPAGDHALVSIFKRLGFRPTEVIYSRTL